MGLLGSVQPMAAIVVASGWRGRLMAVSFGVGGFERSERSRDFLFCTLVRVKRLAVLRRLAHAFAHDQQMTKSSVWQSS